MAFQNGKQENASLKQDCSNNSHGVREDNDEEDKATENLPGAPDSIY